MLAIPSKDNNTNMGKVTIREIKKEDINHAKEYMEFINTLVEEDAMIGLNKKTTIEDVRNSLRNLIAKVDSGERLHLTAWDRENLVGLCDIKLKKFCQSHMGQLAVMIAKDYRNQGIGTRMIKKALDMARNISGLKIVEMIVFSTNERAIRLYKKLGFKDVAKIPREYEYRSVLIDSIIMQYEI